MKNHRYWLILYSKVLTTLRFRGKTTQGIAWSRGLVYGGVASLIFIVTRLIAQKSDLSLVQIGLLWLILFAFIYFSLAYYISLRYAEVNFLKFLYIAVYICTIAIPIVLLIEYLFYHVLGKYSTFVEIKTRQLTLDNVANLKEEVDKYKELMTLGHSLKNLCLIFYPGAVVFSFISYIILSIKVKQEIKEMRALHPEISPNLPKITLRGSSRDRDRARRRRVIKK